MMTPLPGSADHRELYLQGKWLEPDLNRYDSEHAAAEHPRMSAAEWAAIYDRAWHLYYSPAHVETLMRRALAGGTRLRRLAGAIFTFYGSHTFEKVHPLQAGAFRRKVRRTRRPRMPTENLLRYWVRRACDFGNAYVRGGLYYLWLHRLRKRLERDSRARTYTDAALATPIDAMVDSAGSRVVSTIPDFDPVKAQNPAWRRAFKETARNKMKKLLGT